MAENKQINSLQDDQTPNDSTESLQTNFLRDDLTLDEITALIVSHNDALANDPLYAQLMNQMQLGNWQEVSDNVKQLKSLYTDSKELDMLEREVALRSEFDQQWSDKVKGKSFIFSPVKLALKLVPIALILAMLGGGVYYAQQARQINATTGARQARADQAQGYLLAGEYEKAIALFEEVLLDDPENESAQKGLVDATRQLELQTAYNEGLVDFKAGELIPAAKTFSSIIEKAPGYRDVNNLLSQIEQSQSLADTFKAAEMAYDQNEWGVAIELYEKLKAQSGEYEAPTVKMHLTESYLNEALAIVALSPAQGADVDQAQSNFRKVLKLDNDEPTAKANNAILTDYATANNALASNNYPRAMQMFEKLDLENPGYLNGHITEQLFQIYMDFATRAEETNDLVTAHSYYQKAAALNVADRSLALQKLQVASIALTPTATPTSTPPPTPTYTPTPRPIPPTPTARPTTVPPTPPPPPTATTVPPTMSSFHGWILFRSNRDGGSSLFVMQTNGAGVQAAPANAREQFDIIYNNEKWSPDRNAQLIIPKEENSSSSAHNIFKVRHDLPENWTRRFRMTDFPGATYDPVWDPTNKRIAFVSNHTGGDEIWVMGTEGQDHKRLTKNGWEWDKHPTWSLNGQELFFYSNRTGLRQIWVMNPDGSGLRQISDGQYEDWDPVIIR